MVDDDARSVLHAVMKQPSMVDYPGKLSVLTFTCGCNFRCGFCQNAGLLAQPSAKTFTFGDLRKKMAKWREDWVTAVTVSGGEPTIHNALPETLQLIRDEGFLIKLDTNGSRPEMLRNVLPLVDYVAMDIKCGLESYPDFVKFSDTAAIKESIALIIAEAKDYEFRTTVVESFHSDQEIAAAGEAVTGAKRWLLQPFLPRPDLPDEALRSVNRTRPNFLQHCRDIAAKFVTTAEVR